MVQASHKIEKSVLVPTIFRTADWNNNWQGSQRMDWEGVKQPFLGKNDYEDQFSNFMASLDRYLTISLKEKIGISA